MVWIYLIVSKNTYSKTGSLRRGRFPSARSNISRSKKGMLHRSVAEQAPARRPARLRSPEPTPRHVRLRAHLPPACRPCLRGGQGIEEGSRSRRACHPPLAPPGTCRVVNGAGHRSGSCDDGAAAKRENESKTGKRRSPTSARLTCTKGEPLHRGRNPPCADAFH